MKKVFDQIDFKNEWLLLSASFLAKFAFVFVITLENAFSSRFYFKTNRKGIGPSKKNGTTDFQNSSPIDGVTYFSVKRNRNFEYFKYFNFETNFVENGNFF